jgi:hypothetical protein
MSTTADSNASIDEIDHGGYSAENFAKEDYDRSGIGAVPPQTGVIGGYPGYPLPISKDEADTLVPSDKDWNEAIEEADDGENIWVESDAEQECDSPELSAENVTICSDRYHDGSDGGLVYSEGIDTHGIRPDGADGLEICGVRFRGDNWPDVSNARVPNDDAGSAAIYCRQSDDVEIHNCEFFGWRWAGILFYSGGDGSELHSYHVHHIPRQGFGYGNALSGADDGHIEVYDAYWNLCRHSIKGGNGDMSYTIENCIQGPRTANHMCDVHSPCEGGEYVYRNISFLTDRVTDYSPRGQPAVNVRGIVSKLLIENCQIEHKEPREAIWLELDNDGEYRDWTDDPWEEVTTVRNNTFDGERKKGVGAHPAGRDGEGFDSDADMDVPSGGGYEQDPEQSYAEDPNVHLVSISGAATYRLEANGEWLKQGPNGGLGYSDERVDERTIRGEVDSSTDDWWIRSVNPTHILRFRIEAPQADLEELDIAMNGADIADSDVINYVATDTPGTEPSEPGSDPGEGSDADEDESDVGDGGPTDEQLLAAYRQGATDMKNEQTASAEQFLASLEDGNVEG